MYSLFYVNKGGSLLGTKDFKTEADIFETAVLNSNKYDGVFGIDKNGILIFEFYQGKIIFPKEHIFRKENIILENKKSQAEYNAKLKCLKRLQVLEELTI